MQQTIGEGAVQHNQRQVTAAARIDKRPAQLTPEIIAKFQDQHVDQLVQSFCKSVDYQNETDRMGMQEHYKSQRSGQTKGAIIVFGLYGMALFALHLAGQLSTWSILTGLIIATATSFSTSLMQAVSALVLSFKMRFKNPEKLTKE